jgi:phosphate transport system substrate-binding protein
MLTILAAPGCGPRTPASRVEDSLTSGRITVVAAREIADLIEREREGFVALYPKAEIRLVRAGSTDALSDLFGARSDLAAISRELYPEERAAAVRGRLELEGFGFARDAIVMVVHPETGVENLAVPGVREVYEGTATRWSAFGGPDAPIEPVVQPMESDLTEAFVQRVMDGQPIRARVLSVGSDSEVVREVARRPHAIGYVSLAWASRAPRTLRIASLDGLPYSEPDLQAVYDGTYPLTRNLNLYLRTTGHPLAKGFVTYIMSREGQNTVHEAGLLPTAVPVRFVRRSPMMGTH